MLLVKLIKLISESEGDWKEKELILLELAKWIELQKKAVEQWKVVEKLLKEGKIKVGEIDKILGKEELEK